jgi:SAM-dependent methyltransferase
MEIIVNNTQALIEKKWTARARTYRQEVSEDLQGFKKSAWLDLIQAQAPDLGRPLDALDVGTGPGYFAVILSQIGWRVVGIDCTAAMLSEAEDFAAKNGVSPRFLLMDSHELDFPDHSFDLLLSRDVAWCLRDPEAAYGQWRRVLRPGGQLLIFDSNWYRYLFDESVLAAKNADILEANERFGFEDFVEPDQALAEALYPSLPMGRYQRPEWDMETLRRLGFKSVTSDLSIGGKVWDEVEKVAYRSSPIFMISAIA